MSTAPPPSKSKLQTLLERSLSSAILLAVLVGVIYWGHPVGYSLLIITLCALTSIEWFCMLRERSQRSSRLLGLIAGLIFPSALSGVIFYYQGEVNSFAAASAFSLAYLIIFTILTFGMELFHMDHQGRSGAAALSSMGITLLSFIYPVWLFSFALSALNNAEHTHLLLWLIIVTKMCDIWAYVSGMLLGRKFVKAPFSPMVSPKKTWEGIIGSFLITTTCAYFLLPFFQQEGSSFPLFTADGGINCVVFLAVCAITFVLSVTGDLAGSLIKRGLEVKDSGSLLPGIGGVFDLIDSPAFTVSAMVTIYYCSTLI